MLKMHDFMPIVVEAHTNFHIKLGTLIGRSQLTIIVRFFSPYSVPVIPRMIY